MIIMRYNERTDGIAVFDQHMQKYGLSRAAGTLALAQSGLSRFVLAIPIILGGPLIIKLFETLKFYPKNVI